MSGSKLPLVPIACRAQASLLPMKNSVLQWALLVAGMLLNAESSPVVMKGSSAGPTRHSQVTSPVKRGEACPSSFLEDKTSQSHTVLPEVVHSICLTGAGPQAPGNETLPPSSAQTCACIGHALADIGLRCDLMVMSISGSFPFSRQVT